MAFARIARKKLMSARLLVLAKLLLPLQNFSACMLGFSLNFPCGKTEKPWGKMHALWLFLKTLRILVFYWRLIETDAGYSSRKTPSSKKVIQRHVELYPGFNRLDHRSLHWIKLPYALRWLFLVNRFASHRNRSSKYLLDLPRCWH